MNGLLLNVIYGGRVDNDFDMRILQSYLNLFFSSRTLGKQQIPLCSTITIPLSNNIQVSSADVPVGKKKFKNDFIDRRNIWESCADYQTKTSPPISDFPPISTPPFSITRVSICCLASKVSAFTAVPLSPSCSVLFVFEHFRCFP